MFIYDWPGMKTYTYDEAVNLYKTNKSLAGYYKCYPDNTEGQIEDSENYGLGELDHDYSLGIVIGEEVPRQIFALPNCTLFTAPQELEIKTVTFFDDLEYETWELMKKYFDKLSIRLIDFSSNAEPDWASVAVVRDAIIKTIEDAGVKIRNTAEN